MCSTLAKMMRQLLALVLLLAVGLQGSLAAFAAVDPAQSACQTAAESQAGPSHTPCCPSGSHAMNCCLDACPTAVAVSSSDTALVWYRRGKSSPQSPTTTFSSRGDSPLVRPPIL